MKRLRGLALLCAVLLEAPLSASTGGTSLAVPLHTPPRLRPDGGKTSFALSAGWAGVHGPGLSIDGPGGGWELASASARGLGGAIHAEAYMLRGSVDPSGAGRIKTTGMTGSVEGDLVWAPAGLQGRCRLYLGAQAAMSALDFSGTRSVVTASGATAVEPSGAYSLLVGFPIGASVGGALARGWTGQAGAHLATYAGGVSFYSYSLRGQRLYGSSRGVSAHVAAGGHLRAEYLPWRLSVEAGGSAASGSGDSRGLTAFWTSVGWRFF